MVCKHGQLNIKRRLYHDGQGKYRFLLNEALGLKRRRAMTPLVASYAAALAAHVPFRVVKVGIAYSGKSGGKTQNKVIHLDLDDGEAFWQGLTVKIAKVFDLKQA